METIRRSIASLTTDRAIQAILIAFSFGAFLEGAAGFGAPVAITAAMLVALGFAPQSAAVLCLLANTAPVAFGALGVPILVISLRNPFERNNGLVEIAKDLGGRMDPSPPP